MCSYHVHTTFILRSYRVHFHILTTLVAVYIVLALSPSSPTNIHDEFELPLPLASAVIRLPCRRLIHHPYGFIPDKERGRCQLMIFTTVARERDVRGV
jgi:hypothetical protein